MLRQRALKYVYYSSTYVNCHPGRLQRLGTTPTPSDRTSGMTSPWRPEASYLWRQICRSPCWLRLGDARPGPRLKFSSPPESPTDGLHMLLAHVNSFKLPDFLSSLLLSSSSLSIIDHRHRCWPPSSSSSPSSSSVPCSSGTSIFLFYVIGFFFIYEINFLLPLQIVQLKYVIFL
jgi:hypothetical protein